jgi:hypothetical protein
MGISLIERGCGKAAVSLKMKGLVGTVTRLAGKMPRHKAPEMI